MTDWRERKAQTATVRAAEHAARASQQAAQHTSETHALLIGGSPLLGAVVLLGSLIGGFLGGMLALSLMR
jgi:predicted lipid-binding transport protein (Tim44 family)